MPTEYSVIQAKDWTKKFFHRATGKESEDVKLMEQLFAEALDAAPPYVITDADVEKAARAICITMGESCQVQLFSDHLKMARAALDAVVKGLEDK